MLNCFYKIISRVIATRLQKYMDKLTNVCQKGYSSIKQCQEVLVNIIDSISRIKAQGKKGVLVSLDIKKAFDSTSHRYLQHVYEFFNFGPNFVRWINLISTNRRACIILDNELYSSFFDLERGNAQGDTVSPYIFNLGFQILLFKINYDLQIQGITEIPTVPPDLPPLPPEVSTRPYKIFAFADDANTLLKMEVSTLEKLKSVLDDFGHLSGLECNVDKTTLLQVGNNEEIPENIIRCGFPVVGEVTVLGLKLVGSGADTTWSTTDMKNKLKRVVSHWSRFNLSLPGRIAIAKSIMYSQINYLGCFLQIPNRVIEEYSEIIEKFVAGKLNISKSRITKPIDMGGLGLFNLETFLDAQKITWVKRSKNLDDWWKILLYSKSYGNVLNLRYENFSVVTEPCLYSIAKSYEKFLVCYTKSGANYKTTYMFENSALNLGLRDKRLVDKNLFTAQFFTDHGQKIKQLTTSCFFKDDGSYINRNDFLAITEIPLDVMTFQRLKGVLETARIRYGSGTNGNEVDIVTYLNRARKGSKRFRKLLPVTKSDYIPHNIVKFSDNVDIVVGLEKSKKINQFWNTSCLDNSTRTFLFKLYNNTLGYNTTVSHFVRNHSRNCTFCDVVGNEDINDETPLHLMYDCEQVGGLIDSIFKWATDDNDFEITRKEYFAFFCRDGLADGKNFILTYVAKLVLKFVWDCKQRFCLPTINLCKMNLQREFECLCSVNGKFRQMLITSGYNNLL